MVEDEEGLSGLAWIGACGGCGGGGGDSGGDAFLQLGQQILRIVGLGGRMPEPREIVDEREMRLFRDIDALFNSRTINSLPPVWKERKVHTPTLRTSSRQKSSSCTKLTRTTAVVWWDDRPAATKRAVSQVTLQVKVPVKRSREVSGGRRR